jgi:Tfp pilus assembly protein PilV
VIRRGLSLMEVILATSLLMAATVTVGRLAYVTTQNAQRAEDRAMAAQIAEYQIQQLLLGQQSVQTKSRGPVLEPNANLLSTDSPSSPQDQLHPWDEWHVALQVKATSIPRLFQVQVDVFRLRTDQASDTVASTVESQSEPESSEALFTYSVVRLMRVN